MIANTMQWIEILFTLFWLHFIESLLVVYNGVNAWKQFCQSLQLENGTQPTTIDGQYDGLTTIDGQYDGRALCLQTLDKHTISVDIDIKI